MRNMNGRFPSQSAAQPRFGWACIVVAALAGMASSNSLVIAQDIADQRGGLTESRKRVLVIDQEGVTRPAFVLFMEGFRKGLSRGGTDPVDVFVENLDLRRLGRNGQNITQAAGWILEKYAHEPFDVIVPTSGVGRDFVLGARESFSPHARVVALTRPGEPSARRNAEGWMASVGSVSQVDANVRLALRLFPDTQRVAIIGQTTLHPAYLDAVDDEARASAEREGLEYVRLIDLSVRDLLAAVRELPRDSMVIYIGHWGDGQTGSLVPAEFLQTICEESRAPVFGVAESYLGAGIVGGALSDFEGLGTEIGQLVQVAIKGPLPESVDVPLIMRFDAQSLRRFGVPLSRLPAEAEVLFQSQSFWSQYWLQVVLAGLVVFIEATLIGALVVNLRRRVAAEKLVNSQRELMLHTSRLSTLGEFAATLAHELSQPLGAILNNVEAAEMLVQRGRLEAGDVAELREIIADIGSDEQRAGDVLERIRAMVRQQRFAITPVSSSDILHDVQRLAESRCLNEGISLVVEKHALPEVAGDKILLEQALLNLVSNAIDAIREQGPAGSGAGKITLSGSVADDWVEFSVADNGGGFREGDFTRALEAFLTTKPEGLGMGLPIVQSIVEQHEGRVEFENEVGRGVTVRIFVPLWHEGAS